MLLRFTARNRHNAKGERVAVAINPTFVAWVSADRGGGCAIAIAGRGDPIIVEEQFNEVEAVINEALGTAR